MKKCLYLVLFLTIAVSGCQKNGTQEANIHYDVRFPNVAHNEAEITLTIDHLLPGPTTIAISRSSPGRYALHEFAKNIYDVTAVDGSGDTLSIDHPDLHNWKVKKHDGTIKFKYTLYGNHADGTYAGINREHAHLNAPATFAWLPNLPNTPVTVQFHPPENANWKAATQLKETDEPLKFRAPTYSYLMDSPVELSDYDLRSWEITSDSTSQEMQIALHHNGTAKEFDHFTDLAKKVVNQQAAVYGEFPNYDYGKYTFISDYLPYVYGDAMEHRNSTFLTSRSSLGSKKGTLNNISSLSHEFFHCWNVERLRPASLKPFDFMHANVSDALWFAEGFTNYYQDLTIRRAGIISDKKYASRWTGTLNYVLNSAGNQFYSPMGMSKQAPFVDAATSVDEQNKSNTFISYYSWGATIGLGLDLTLRTTFDDVTLDDFMQKMWAKYGKTEDAYTIDDLEQALAEVTDSTEFARDFFDQHIRDGQQVDLKPLLAKAGFALRKAYPQKAVISSGSFMISYKDGAATVSQNTRIGSPLYKAEIDEGDEIKSIDGKEINNAQTLNRLLGKYNPGDEVSVTYSSLGEEYDTKLTLQEDSELEMIPFEQADKKVSQEVKDFRKEWLGKKTL